MTENQELDPPLKKRNALIACLLPLILPGLGQAYNGQLKKSVLVLVSFFLICFVANHWLFGSFKTMSFAFAILIIFQIYCVIDAYIFTKKRREVNLKQYNIVYHLLLGMALGFSYFYVKDKGTFFRYQLFKIPSSSSSPTLQIGDFVVSDNHFLKDEGVKYGDLITFQGFDGSIYVYRVVGLPKDTLEIKDNFVIINSIKSKTTFLKDKRIPIEEIIQIKDFHVSEFLEELPNGSKHNLYKLKEPFPINKTNIEKLIVPNNNYYLLGDNRDNANDSRYIGSIKRENIKGKLKYVFWGESFDRINISL
jgi:signal peptidase I